MSRLYVNKFLYQLDRDPELLASYKMEPAETVDTWDREIGPWMDKGVRIEKITWLAFTSEERAALVEQDYVRLFEMGAHYFVTLQVFMGLFDADFEARSGPLSFQREYAVNLRHWLGKDYPSIGL